MRDAGRRFAALIGQGGVPWRTEVSWSNNGGATWTPLTFVSGNVTCSATSQIRWTTQLQVVGAKASPDQVSPFHTWIKISNGIQGVRMLPMGVYRVTEATQQDGQTIQLSGSSFEEAMIAATFGTKRKFEAADAASLITRLIREVQPSAQVANESDTSARVPRITVTDRWQFIDGQDQSATSLARALGARVFASPSGGWIIRPVPSLADPPVWVAGLGEVVVDLPQETLSIDGVCNRYIVAGPDGDTELFPPQVATDNDPLSDTWVGKKFDQGGIGPRTILYRSELARNRDQAKIMAQAGLAQRLGLKQTITHTELHDPRREPGDVGIVETVNGPRLVLPDSITWDLTGGPMSMETRTTQTRLQGDVTEVPSEDDPVSADTSV